MLAKKLKPLLFSGRIPCSDQGRAHPRSPILIKRLNPTRIATTGADSAAPNTHAWIGSRMCVQIRDSCPKVLRDLPMPRHCSPANNSNITPRDSIVRPRHSPPSCIFCLSPRTEPTLCHSPIQPYPLQSIIGKKEGHNTPQLG